MDILEVKLRILAKLELGKEKVEQLRAKYNVGSPPLDYTQTFHFSRPEASLDHEKMLALYHEVRELMNDLAILPRWEDQMMDYVRFGELEIPAEKVRVELLGDMPVIHLDPDLGRDDVAGDWRRIKQVALKHNPFGKYLKKKRRSIKFEKYWEAWRLSNQTAPKLTQQEIADILDIGVVYTDVSDMVDQAKAWLQDPL